MVVDDTLAFCGGIDMTTDRWGTPEHLDDNSLRTKPNGRAYGSWHDATTAVDGDAARAIASRPGLNPTYTLVPVAARRAAASAVRGSEVRYGSDFVAKVD